MVQRRCSTIGISYLAHTVKNKVEAAYHRTDLLVQRRPMMDAWAEFVTGSSVDK